MSKSIRQERSEIGTIKNYPNGIVGIQQDDDNHNSYKDKMAPLKNVNPANNNILSDFVSKYNS